VVAGVAAIGLGLYLYFKKDPAVEEAEKKKLEDEIKKKDIEKEKIFKKRILDEVASIDKKDVDGIYTKDTIKKINQAITEYCVPELRRLYEKTSSERRAAMDNIKNYLDVYYQHEQQLQDLVEKSKLEVLKHIELPLERWESSLAYHRTSDEDFFQYDSSFTTSTTKQLNDKNYNKEELVKILKEKLNVAAGEVKKFEQFRPHLKKPQHDEPLVFQSWVADVFYKANKIETEFLTGVPPELAADPELSELFEKLGDEFMKVFPDLV